MAVIVPIATKLDDSGIKKAKSAFGGLSKSLKSTIGALGIATSFAALTNGLMDAAKAAVADQKSQVLLANQLRNTVGATNEAIAGAEAFVKTLMMQTSIADDQLRPALSTLVRSTGDLGSAQKLLALSTDIAAGTGKDLSSVSIAVGKAAAGQTTALYRLIPSLKGSSDFAKDAALQFDGMAAAAANADPFQRLNIIMGEIQETVGTYLLPTMQDLANYLASDSFAKVLDSVFDGFDKIGYAIDTLIEKVPALGTALDGLGASLENGKWVKAIPIIGAYIDMLAGNKGIDAKNQTSASRLRGQANSASGGLYTALQMQKEAEALTKGAGTVDKAAAAAAAAAKKARDAAKKAAEAQARLVADFKTTIGELAGAFKPLGEATKELGQFEQQAVDSFEAINQAIIKGLKDKAITQAAAEFIYNYIRVEKVALTALARQRDVILNKIAIAQQISGSFIDAANITGLLTNETRQVTKSVTSLVDGIATTVKTTFDEVVTGNLADSFKKLVDKTKNFAKNLVTLKKLGLNGTLFKQIVDAGAEAGGATAEAIIAGGADTVSELNGLFNELNTAGSQIAETSTDTFYSLGEGISNSFIDGLKSQEAALAEQIASMVASIEAAFASMMARLSTLAMPNFGGTNANGFAYSSDPMLGGSAESQFGSGTPWAQAVANYQRSQAPSTMVKVTVNAGLGTNGKQVGQQIQSLLNQYAKANA